MVESYSQELHEVREDKRDVTRPWLQCYLCQTVPTFEDCEEHFREEGMLLIKEDYEEMCNKIHKEPRYAKKPEQE